MSNKVIIMSGVPGCGKSTYIKENFPDALICSADHYFECDDGSYDFDAKLLPKAHGACMRKFAGNLHMRESNFADPGDVIVVDNTNTTVLEIAPYVALASAYHRAEVEIITIMEDPEICAKRNAHGVPLSACIRMHNNIVSRKLPPFWDVKLTMIGSYWTVIQSL